MHVWAHEHGICDAAAGVLREAGHTVHTEPFGPRCHDVYWTRCMNRGYWRAVWNGGFGYRMIACPATGTDHLDWAVAQGIKVLSLRDCGDLSSIRATVEFTIGAILALARRIPSAVESVRRGEWDRMRFQGTDLAGKTAGVVGFGRIGRAVQQILNYGFQMDVLFCDPVELPAEKWDECWDFGERHQVTIDDVLREADIITVHASLNETSRGMFGREQFAAMKPGALFINTSRGAVVDEAALLDALASGHLAGAALDVLCDEPPNQDNPLLDFARREPMRLLITPHLGGCSKESLERAEVMLAKRLVEELNRGG